MPRKINENFGPSQYLGRGIKNKMMLGLLVLNIGLDKIGVH